MCSSKRVLRLPNLEVHRHTRVTLLSQHASRQNLATYDIPHDTIVRHNGPATGVSFHHSYDGGAWHEPRTYYWPVNPALDDASQVSHEKHSSVNLQLDTWGSGNVGTKAEGRGHS